jgi:Protein of unknown function (DUF2690)
MNLMLEKIPQSIRQSMLAALYISLGASGKEPAGLFTPQNTRIAIIVKSESTNKILSDAEVKILVNGAPINLKTDSNGYVEKQIQTKAAVQAEISKTGYGTKNETFNLTVGLDKPFEVLLPIDRQSPTCFGDSCTGRIARSAKCDGDVTTINYSTGEKFVRGDNVSDVIRVEMRFSKVCNSIWAKAVAPTGSLVYLQDEKMSKLTDFFVPDDNFPNHHGEMVSGDLRLRACVTSSQGDKKITCTGVTNLN